MKNLHDLRVDYSRASLSSQNLEKSPFDQFQKWFDDAVTAQVDEPNAMCLATVGTGGVPSTRVVLLKNFSSQGLTFFTNYESRKATELGENANVSVNFLWLPIQRQVNILGFAERISKSETLKYFISRPLASQLGAWTSPQSKVISSRQILETKWDQMKRKFAEGEVPVPDNWGGYRIVPHSFEFWQGRKSRLHDRYLYQKCDDGGWTIVRLAP